MSYYIHHTRGRLRVRIPTLRKRQDLAEAVERLLDAHPGVLSVEASATTGSVLVRFEPSELSGERITAVLIKEGWLPFPEASQAWSRASSVSEPEMRRREVAVEKFVIDLLQMALKKSLERALLRLF